MKAVTKILAVAGLSLIASTSMACERYKGAEAIGKNKCSVPTGRYTVSGNLGDSDRYSATLWVTGCQVHMVIEDSTKPNNAGDYLITRNRLKGHDVRFGEPGRHHKKGKGHKHKKGNGHGHGHHKGPHGKHGGAKMCRGTEIKFGFGNSRIAIANPSNLIGEVRLEYKEEGDYLTGSIKLGEENTILNDTTVNLIKQK
ncbi:hypothetical protein [Endozoicomonas arenosclerae]|uniref:hypothetical protein n=1 Tax=Endozoicomonas arenosclerae TaxID=1633495 RepID=UPI000782B608|nr:hypothetical protein [Endozoicomonas arenosclerae]